MAYHFIGEPGDTCTVTYRDLHRMVCRFTNAMKRAGLQPGDSAVIYMPMVPELPAALLACARLGVVHSVVFGGFSAEALRFRVEDLEASIVITADGGWRRGKEVRLKDTVDEALSEGCATVKNVVVLKRTNSQVPMKAGRDVFWNDFVYQLTLNQRVVGWQQCLHGPPVSPSGMLEGRPLPSGDSPAFIP
ncbi:MAG: AMP-binding protein [Bryobacterales bacterium]|nr:AMP-binding protein [Bryobacterales bacterium]